MFSKKNGDIVFFLWYNVVDEKTKPTNVLYTISIEITSRFGKKY